MGYDTACTALSVLCLDDWASVVVGVMKLTAAGKFWLGYFTGLAVVGLFLWLG